MVHGSITFVRTSIFLGNILFIFKISLSVYRFASGVNIVFLSFLGQWKKKSIFYAKMFFFVLETIITSLCSIIFREVRIRCIRTYDNLIGTGQGEEGASTDRLRKPRPCPLSQFPNRKSCFLLARASHSPVFSVE